MSEPRERDGEEPADAGLVGGGGPDATIEGDEPEDADAHLADTDHSEL